MQKICRNCQVGFEVSEDDLKFYKKISPIIAGQIYEIPIPQFCYACRLQRRLSLRNDMNLFRRKCAKSGEEIISMFSDPEMTVYKSDVWWGDSWDGLDYARDYDFNRSFFEQWQELNKVVPHMHNITVNCENSLYTNYNVGNKNCYLCSAGNYLEDSLYCYNVQNSRNCTDCLFVWESENLYECVQCVSCYECFYCLHSKNCHNSMFLDECISCNDCLMCFNLRNKKYCILNKQYSKEEYLKKKNEALSKGIEECFKFWKVERMKYPKRENHNLQSENCSSEYIIQSKNCHDCYIMAKECEDCRYVFNGFPGLKDSYDCLYCGEYTSQVYESIGSGINSSKMLFCNLCFEGSGDILYSSYLIGCKNCFGCSNLKKKQYCILNKQYTKSEYENLMPRIIVQMKGNGEWGEFFPTERSLFGYNETLANLYFPLSKEEILNKGWKWMPEKEDVKASNGENLLKCAETGKVFKIVAAEVAFYKKWNLPFPKISFSQRHKHRMELMNSWRSHNLICANCGKVMITNYEKESAAKVYCEECYLKEIY